MADFYWPSIGMLTGGIVLGAFALGIVQRRWNGRALYVSFGCLAVALLHMVAPFRASLDPEYPGYSFGLIRLDGGLGVGLVAGFLYLLATCATVTAIRNRDGRAMWFLAALSGFVLVNLGLYLIAGLAGLVPPYRIQLGQYFQLSPLPATLVAVAVILLPFVVGLRWSVRKARAGREALPVRR